MKKLMKIFLVTILFASVLIPINADNSNDDNLLPDNVIASGKTSLIDNSSNFVLTEDLDMYVNGGINSNIYTDEYKEAMQYAKTLTFGNEDLVKFIGLDRHLIGFKNVTKIQFILIDTNEVDATSDLFSGLDKLEEIDFGDYFDTQFVTQMNGMFNGAKKLKRIELPPTFKTSNVKHMANMFANTSSLEFLDLGDHFDTSKVYNMSRMFEYSGLKNLDLKDKFDTSEVEDAERMFFTMSNLETLKLGEIFNTHKVRYMAFMFGQLPKLQELNLGDKFDTSNVVNMKGLFENVASIKTLDLGDKFYTSKVTDMSYMFYAMKGITTLDFGPHFDTRMTSKMTSMLSYLGSVQSLDLSSFSIDDSTTIDSMLSSTPLQQLTLGPNVKTLKDTNLPSVVSNQIYTGGWYLQENPLIKYASSRDFTTNYNGENSDHIGTYVLDLMKYNVSYQFPEGSSQLPIQDGDYTPGTIYNVKFNNAPSMDGHTFIGWTDLDENKLYTPINNQLTMGYKNVILTATFEPNVYHVTFKDNETEISSAKVNYSNLITPTDIPNAVEKPGHSFYEWNTKKDGSGISFDPSTELIVSDITVYAVYHKNTYTVSFWDGNDHIKDISVAYHDYIDESLIPAVPNLKGHSFVGWSLEDSKDDVFFDFSKDVIEDNINLYVNYVRNQYNVYFMEGKDVTLEVLNIYYDHDFMLIDIPVKDGYIGKWVNSEGDYKAGDTFTMSDEDMTFTLVYTPLEDDSNQVPVLPDDHLPNTPDEKHPIDKDNSLPATGISGSHLSISFIILGGILISLRKRNLYKVITPFKR